MSAIPTTAATIESLLDQPRLSPVQRKIITICIVMAMLDGFDAQAIGYAAPAIGPELGIAPASFALVFSTGLAGMALGSILFGAFADRIGRRAVIMICAVLFAASTLAIATADSFTMLIVLRFLAGLGLGGATPSLIALSAEYTPQRLRSTIVMIIVGSLALGSFLGGLLAAFLMPAFGWRSVFVVGGLLPVLMLVAVIVWLPDSIAYLLSRGRLDAATRIARKIAPEFTGTLDGPVLAETGASGSSVQALFSGRKRVDTLLLWCSFFMTLLMLFMMLNWLPTLLQQTGLSQRTAVIATACFSLGGFIGSIVLGRIIDRRGWPYGPIVVGYALTVIFTGATALSTSSAVLTITFALLLGFAVMACQTGISAVAAALYPAAARGTGVGWAFGVGRVGSILGPAFAGALIAAGLAPTAVIAVAAAPAVAAAAAVAALGRRNRADRPSRSKAPTP